MRDYYNTLIEEYGYTPYEAELTIEDIREMDEETKNTLDMYLSGKSIISYGHRDYSVETLVSDYSMNEIAALIAISELKKDYDGFVDILKLGVK